MNNTETTALTLARENHAARAACTGHLFQRIGHHGQYRCRHCGATADSRFVDGYLQGLAHSREAMATHGRINWTRNNRMEG